MWDLVEPINGYDHLCIRFVDGCVLLLVVYLILYLFIISGVNCVYMCGLVVDSGSLCVWICVLACVYVGLFYVLCVFLLLVVAPSLPIRTL